MKRLISVFLVVAIFFATIPAPTAAAQENLVNRIILQVGNPSAQVNGRTVLIDPRDSGVAPFILSGRVLVPVRFISEYLMSRVSWDPFTKRVTIFSPGVTIVMHVGEPVAFVNNVATPMDDSNHVTPVLKEERTFVPLRFLAKALGIQANWNPYDMTITIEQQTIPGAFTIGTPISPQPVQPAQPATTPTTPAAPTTPTCQNPTTPPPPTTTGWIWNCNGWIQAPENHPNPISKIAPVICPDPTINPPLPNNYWWSSRTCLWFQGSPPSIGMYYTAFLYTVYSPSGNIYFIPGASSPTTPPSTSFRIEPWQGTVYLTGVTISGDIQVSYDNVTWWQLYDNIEWTGLVTYVQGSIWVKAPFGASYVYGDHTVEQQLLLLRSGCRFGCSSVTIERR